LNLHLRISGENLNNDAKLGHLDGCEAILRRRLEINVVFVHIDGSAWTDNLTACRTRVVPARENQLGWRTRQSPGRLLKTFLLFASPLPLQ
jgi:hypothetical protein